MSAAHISRRAVTVGLAALPVVLDFPAWASAASGSPDGSASAEGAGLSRSSEAIHQEVSVNASRARVYEALTSAKRFDALTRLSDAVSLVTAPGAQPTTISADVGGAFTLFGGYIMGRHLEMVPDERLVQAWRARSWRAGDYSVVKFELLAEGTACKVVLDHRGFPEGQGRNLAYGWGVHYWEPLAKLLAQ